MKEDLNNNNSPILIMVKPDKANDRRMWDRWERSGAVGTVIDAKIRQLKDWRNSRGYKFIEEMENVNYEFPISGPDCEIPYRITIEMGISF